MQPSSLNVVLMLNASTLHILGMVSVSVLKKNSFKELTFPISHVNAKAVFVSTSYCAS